MFDARRSTAHCACESGIVARERLEGAIEEQLANGVVGASVAVVVDDQIVWSGGYGVVDIDDPAPVSPTTAFSAQSLTKPVVATALMRFVEDGTIGLDDPVNAHLGEVRLANSWEDELPVTIRQLLTHTGGLGVSAAWHSTISLEDEVTNHVSTEAAPGSRLVYANGGYDTLGCVLAHLAGSAWDEVVTRSVFVPLEMTATRIGAPPAGHESCAVGHVLSQMEGRVLRLQTMPWPYDPPPPSGSMVSTAEDLADFLLAHLNGGGGVVGSETATDMHRLHAPLGPGGGGMGLGFRVDRRGGRAFFCHGGDGVGFTTFIGAYPDERVGVVVLLNSGGAQEARSVIASAALAYGLDEPAVRSTPARVDPQLLGSYRSTFWELRADLIQPGDHPLLHTSPGAIVSAETTTRLEPAGDRWRGDGGMFDGWELDLVAGADGPRLYGGVYPFEYVADDTSMPRLPTTVDPDGELAGTWAGTTHSPIGPVPLELVIHPPNAATVTTMGVTDVALSDFEAGGGWVTGHFDVDVDGIGQLRVSLRLGLATRRLEGMAYARSEMFEFAMPTELELPT
jgi:CubicO group peptidase (beta-lactamase class C family)